jgi:secreted Zn-dependent insulinase-like peptidase
VNIRADLIRSLENSVAKRPSSQLIDDLREALLHGEWGEQALIEALQAMTPIELTDWVEAFWAQATAETMLYGNYDAAVVPQLATRVGELLAAGEAPPLPPLRVTRIAPGDSLQFPVEIDHDDAVVGWYLQGGDRSWHDRAATTLTAHIIKTGFFQQLRTEQQLGYVVSAFSWPQLDVPGLMLLIQSPSATAPEVIAAIDAYMDSVAGSLDEEQFLRYRKSLVAELERPDKNLWERAEFYWQSIAKKEFAFDGRQQLAAAVGALTLEDWNTYFTDVFRAQRRSLLVVAPGRAQALPEGYGEAVESAAALKARQAFYTIE